MTWNRDIGRIIDRLDATLNTLLDPSGADKNGLPRDQKIMALAILEGLRAINAELDLKNAPKVDGIVIISEDPQEVGDLKQHRKDIRKKLTRDDIPVVVMTPTNKGSGNAYFEALRLIKTKFKSKAFEPDELQGQYFDKLKPWEDARVLFVFHGKEAAQNNTLIDWGITNGYRAAASMAQSTKGGSQSGNIIIFSRDLYFGPIQQVSGSDITILTSKVNEDQLKSLGWVSTSFSEDGNSEVGEILEKEDFKELLEQDRRARRGSKTVQFFRSKLYDLNNPSLKQFTAFNGMILLGPDVVAMNVKIEESLQSNKGLAENLPIHFTSDWLIPTLRARDISGKVDELQRSDIYDYVMERVKWPDMREAKGDKLAKQLRILYRIIYAVIKPGIKIHAYVPHPGAEVYWPNMRQQQGTNERIKGLLLEFSQRIGTDHAVISIANKPSGPVGADHAVISTANKSSGPGGIDLNFQPQFIQRSSSSSSASLQEAAMPDMPDGFKGFNFNIVRFTPNLTANGAFQLMFNPD
jgi:hypothetical protein